jgi:hypothetical protein
MKTLFGNKDHTNQCYYCERQFASAEAVQSDPLNKTVDHIHPMARRGTNIWCNRVYACAECNVLKDLFTLHEFGVFLAAVLHCIKTKRSWGKDWQKIRKAARRYQDRAELIKCIIVNVQLLAEQVRPFKKMLIKPPDTEAKA